MSTLLGPDGRFTFTGVPADAQLHFMRDDGIDARMAVPAKASAFTVELNGNTAKPGRRRAVPSNPKLEIEGLIVTAAADSLVVHSSHNEDVTVQLTDTTVIRHGQTPIAATDLKEGDRVHVKATVKDGVNTAVEVIVQNQGEDDGEDDGGEATMTANGVVKSVGADSLVVASVPKGDVTVQVNGDTIIKKQGVHIGLADIHEGDEVNTMGKKVDDQTLLARQIEVRGKGKGHS